MKFQWHVFPHFSCFIVMIILLWVCPCVIFIVQHILTCISKQMCVPHLYRVLSYIVVPFMAVFESLAPRSPWLNSYFMYDPKCSTTFPWYTINSPVAFAWCTINASAPFAWCTNHFVHKVEFSYIGWNGVHPLWRWGWKHNGRHFANDVFNHISLNQNLEFD